ncbi:MAG: hypothetical protein KA248_12505 [Kiritimatiellae bacterium]|nr:hypothetical protein [Kiritimatiellia bacterium]
MATMTFSKPAPAQEQGAEVSDKQVPAVVAREDTAAVAVAAPPVAGDVSGELHRSMIMVPRLNVVQAVGGLSEQFDAGTVVFNGEIVLAKPGEPMEIVVAHIHVCIEEDLEFGSEAMPRRWESREQALKEGMTLDWGPGDERPSARYIAEGLAFVREPANDESGQFIYPCEGVNYALAMWKMAGAAFTSAGKILISARKFALREGLHTGKFTLTTVREKRGTNMVWVPKLRQAGKTGEAFRAFVEDVLKG